MCGKQLLGSNTKKDVFQAAIKALGGYSNGIRITIHLQDDNGELGAITDGILELGGKLISIFTYWECDTQNRMITLIVEEVNSEELVWMLKNYIGVEIVECRESSLEHQIETVSSEMK